MVCLEKVCREDPLACSVCFSSAHKYHKVVSLDKFLSDYFGNVKRFSQPSLTKKISRQYSLLKEHIGEFRSSLISEFDRFEDSIDCYAEYLQEHLGVRKEIGYLLDTKLEPEEFDSTGSFHELSKSIRFILNNSLFDDSKNMVNMSELLKQDRDKVYALLDRMVNMTEHCQRSIMKAMESFSFASDIIVE